MASFSVVMMVIVAMIIVQGQTITEAQVQGTCSDSLTSLNVCAPFVVPGASTTPSGECCNALQAVDHDCLCNTLRIAARIPAQCNLAPLTCAN